MMMIQEALDTDKKWKPIEFIFEPNHCGTGHSDLKILPKHYIATGMIKYHGDFQTKIRIRLYSQGKIYYSNAISGNINRSQFNPDFIRGFLKEREEYIARNFDENLRMMFLKR